MSRPVVTVKTLVTWSRRDGEIALPENALVTPAAADWLRDTRVPVRRVGACQPERSEDPGLFLIGNDKDSFLQTLLPQLERRHPTLAFLSCRGQRPCMLECLEKVCRELGCCSRRRAVMVIRAGAIAACVANKHPHVRAAIVDTTSALRALQRDLDPNLLIVEQDRVSLHQARALIEAFLGGTGELDPVIETALHETASAASRAPVAAAGER